MKVSELTAYIVRVPLKKRIKHASHARTETDNVLVRVRLNDNSVGWGEGVPREYVTGESADSALDLLKRCDLKGQLGDCRDFHGALRIVEAFQPAAVPGDTRGVQGNAARCAVELPCSTLSAARSVSRCATSPSTSPPTATSSATRCNTAGPSRRRKAA
jgi:muconate cycloisomerase